MTRRTAPPTFTIVSAVYNVARYLPDFIDSIENQTHPLDDVEVIMVDDGSTDDSLSVLRAWQERRPELVTILQRENGGQAAARNDGLDRATGTWITFTDPDDALDPDYLSNVVAALTRWPDVAMIATNRITWRDLTGERVEEHSLRGLFEYRDQLKDLDQFPDFFHGSAPAAFVQRAVVNEHAIRFDTRIRPNFEDGHFLQVYLLRCDPRTVAFLSTARYFYRQRGDRSSTIQTGLADPRKFRDVPRHGYLELLQEAAEMHGGRPPAWLQSMIIYELSHFISPEDSIAGNATACHGSVAEEFVTILRQIRTLLDDDVIDAFRTRRLRIEWYQVLRYGLVETPWHSDVVLHRYDERRKQVLLSYRWTGQEPALEIILRGIRVDPSTSKVRTWEYFDHVMMRERMVWVSAAGSLRVRLDDRPAALTTQWQSQPTLDLRPAALRRALGSMPPLVEPPKSRFERAKKWAILRLAANRLVRRRYRRAWVLMDRIADADDNAEVLFGYLRANHPDINAWFVIQRRTPHGKRLGKAWGRRVVPYGSLRWKLLMLNSQHLVSSHAEVPIIRPQEVRELAPPKWKTTFLQHGVTHRDLSSWLNPKPFDLLITSTPAEQLSIAGSESRWKFTDKEARLLGMPRLDDLQRCGERHGDKLRDLVLIVPTWRNWLNLPSRPNDTTRRVIDGYLETDHARNWLGLLQSAEVAEACQEQSLQLGFLPHPNLRPILSMLSLPSHVDVLDYGDARPLFARAATAVTDYSSVAFDIGFLERPVVYFQFDEDLIQAGGHTGRAGYYDFRRDGYGPVVTTLDEAVAATIESLGSQGRMQQPYLDRAAKDFALVRDGQCCERVTQAIKSL